MTSAMTVNMMTWPWLMHAHTCLLACHRPCEQLLGGSKPQQRVFFTMLAGQARLLITAPLNTFLTGRHLDSAYASDHNCEPGWTR